MCGRYSSTRSPADLADEFRAVDATDGAGAPDFNVAPTKQIYTVVQRHPRDDEGNPDPDTTERTLRRVRWGLVPSWSKDASGGARMINARSETAADKPAFRRALASRRCLLPADGWFEWQRRDTATGKTKQPYFTHFRDGSSVAMAGLWEFWRPREDPDGEYPEGLVTAAVLTTEAVGPLAEVHDRMPLVLPRDAWDDWLDPDIDAKTDRVARWLVPPSAQLVAAMELRPVSNRVNNVRNNGPELLDALAPEDVEEPLQLDLLNSGQPPEPRVSATAAAPAPVRDVDTPHGPARVHLHLSAGPPRGTLLLGHGAGGGVAAPDLVAATAAATAAGVHVGLVEQPYRVAGRRAPAPAGQLDTAWLAVVAALHAGVLGPELAGLPLVTGGRSSGARVACRTSAHAGAVGVVCLAFPVHPPGKPEKDRLGELGGVTVPVLVVQGERDPFGRPEPAAGRQVVLLAGDHGLKADRPGVERAVADWLGALLGA